MLKLLIVLYLACFGSYLFFSRQPDWFDSERIPAVIVKQDDKLVAQYTILGKNYFAEAEYVFRSLTPGQKVEVIYEQSQMQHAKMYAFWGYWITWKELLASFIIITGAYFAATSIVARPSAASLIEQLEEKEPERKRKYID